MAQTSSRTITKAFTASMRLKPSKEEKTWQLSRNGRQENNQEIFSENLSPNYKTVSTLIKILQVIKVSTQEQY